MPKFLVEVRVKEFKPPLKSGGRTFDYIEVESNTEDEFHIRIQASYKYETLASYIPSIEKKLKAEGLQLKDLCYPDCVKLS